MYTEIPISNISHHNKEKGKRDKYEYKINLDSKINILYLSTYYIYYIYLYYISHEACRQFRYTSTPTDK